MGAKMGTVWVTNDGGHDFSPAEQFGQVKYLTKGKVNIFAVDRLAQDLSKAVGKFVDEDDYLLLAGAQIISILATILWLERFGQVKVLQWGNRDQDYELSIIDRSHLAMLVERELLELR